MNPLVSIIIPCYHSEKHIRQCVDSILAQTFTDWEAIFVVDDASATDPTFAYLSGLHDHRILVLPSRRKTSPAHARNVGVSCARGTFIAFLDADDWWYPEKLKKQLAGFDLNWEPPVDWCYSYATMHNGLKEYMCEQAWDNPRADEMIPFQTVMIRRSLVDKIIKEDGALFDESLKQIDDYDLFLRLKKYPHFHLKEPLSHYRIHNGGLTTSSSHMEIVETQLGINIKRGQWQNLPRILQIYIGLKARIYLKPAKKIVDKWLDHHRVTLQIEPTTRCNLHCTKCSRGNDTPIVDLKEEILLNLSISYHPHTTILQGLGEPFMHPDFENICRVAKQNCKHLIVITNGTILNKPALEHIDHIVVSLDGLDEDMLKATRGSNYNLSLVIDNIRSIASSNKPTVAINYVRTVNNFNQQKALQNFCDDLNIPLRVTPIMNFYNPEELEWQAAHEAVHYEREMSWKKDKPFRDNCPFLDGRKVYYDARGVQHICCIRMRYDQVHPTRGSCRTCPE